MSERKPEEDNVYIEFNNVSFECTQEGTSVYLHEGAHSVYDHIFVEHQNDPEEEEAGIAIFREMVENFDETVQLMRDRNFSFVEKPEASNFDQEMYVSYFGHAPLTTEAPPYALTERLEELVHHFGQTLLNMPDALLYDELTSPHERPHNELWRTEQ